MKTLRLLGAAVVLFSVAALGSSAEAGFAVKNTDICEITGADFDDFQEAVALNNQSYNRGCTWLISFIDSGTMVMDSAIEIKGEPVHNGFGTMISRPSNVSFILDAQGLGDCPIKVKVGAKIDIKRITIKADNVNKAVCTLGGNSVYGGVDASGHVTSQTDQQMETVYIHPDVTILQAPAQPSGNDADGDGVIDSSDDCPDTPAGTEVDDHGCPVVDEDTDDDGIVNEDDLCPATPAGATVNTVGCPDTDGDTVFDNEDDCDNLPGPASNDGCPVTGGGCVDGDSDADGVCNGQDKCDEDSTGGACGSATLAACFTNAADNVCAGVPVGASVACSETEDMDNDGRGNRCDPDIDGDTLSNIADPDPYDKDADNDGVNDNVDPCPLLNGVTLNSLGQCAAEPGAVTNYDPDNDGLTNTLEGIIGTNPNLADSDGDGFLDGVDCYPTDATRQSCGESVILTDPDFDNDGICNEAVSGTDPITNQPCTPNPTTNQGDNCPAIPNADQADANNNGVGDACEISPSLDGDGDGIPDEFEDGAVFCTSSTEADTDHDGLNDGAEVNGATYQGGRGPCDPDVDEDGICDGPASVNDADGNPVCTTNATTGGGDNCPIVSNGPNTLGISEGDVQKDSDGDGVGDVCQGDTDGDGVGDTEDNCAFIPNEDQADDDGDGIGNACDVDFDVSLAEGGCGCRIDGASIGSASSALPFLAMVLPMIFFRIARRRGRK